ncbi:hypothetical protein LCGC14_3150040, partial [marine sediment metagenome]
PISEYSRKRGDRIGYYWWIPSSRRRRLLRTVHIDTNYCPAFVAEGHFGGVGEDLHPHAAGGDAGQGAPNRDAWRLGSPTRAACPCSAASLRSIGCSPTTSRPSTGSVPRAAAGRWTNGSCRPPSRTTTGSTAWSAAPWRPRPACRQAGARGVGHGREVTAEAEGQAPAQGGVVPVGGGHANGPTDRQGRPAGP